MNCARCASSSSPDERPDFESSPEVLTWMRTFRRDCRSSGQFLFSAVASFWDETVWTAWRFGIAEVFSCHPWGSIGRCFQVYVHAASFALFDWRVPMKCQCMSLGSWSRGSGSFPHRANGDAPVPLSQPTPARSSHQSGDGQHRSKPEYPKRVCTSTRPPRLVPDLDLWRFVGLLT